MNVHGSKWIRPVKRLAIYLRDGFACAYCGRDLRSAPRREVTLDHLIPRCEGGGNHETNLITACLSCNSSRQDRSWLQYATGGAIERIETLRYTQLNIELAAAVMSGDSNAVEWLR